MVLHYALLLINCFLSSFARHPGMRRLFLQWLYSNPARRKAAVIHRGRTLPWWYNHSASTNRGGFATKSKKDLKCVLPLWWALCCNFLCDLKLLYSVPSCIIWILFFACNFPLHFNLQLTLSPSYFSILLLRRASFSCLTVKSRARYILCRKSFKCTFFLSVHELSVKRLWFSQMCIHFSKLFND